MDESFIGSLQLRTKIIYCLRYFINCSMYSTHIMHCTSFKQDKKSVHDFETPSITTWLIMSGEPSEKKAKIETMTTPEKPRVIAMFDVDGTLTIPRGEVTTEMMAFMKELSKKVTVGIVGGSDLPKQEEQLGDGIVNVFPYNFSQNGLVAYKDGKLLEIQTISKHLGEGNVKKIVNWVMKYLCEVDIPVKVRNCFYEESSFCVLFLEYEILIIMSIIFVSY